MFKQLFTYLWKNKMWWLVPPVIVLIITSALVALATITPISPFIYALF